MHGRTTSVVGPAMASNGWVATGKLPNRSKELPQSVGLQPCRPPPIVSKARIGARHPHTLRQNREPEAATEGRVAPRVTPTTSHSPPLIQNPVCGAVWQCVAQQPRSRTQTTTRKHCWFEHTVRGRLGRASIGKGTGHVRKLSVQMDDVTAFAGAWVCAWAFFHSQLTVRVH